MTTKSTPPSRSANLGGTARMNRSSTLLAFACSIVIVGCGGIVPPAIEHVAYAQLVTNGTYEVQLRYSITSSGGPCLSKDWFSSWTSYSTNWLYLKALDGAVTADQIVLRAGVKDDVGDFSYAIEGLRGTVSFDQEIMTVRLEQPNVLPSGEVRGYAPYYLNGAYQIVKR